MGELITVLVVSYIFFSNTNFNILHLIPTVNDFIYFKDQIIKFIKKGR